MITAVDTSILIDVLAADEKFGPKSAAALKESRKQGAIVACSVVWAETATGFSTPSKAAEALERIDLEFGAISREAALAAAQAWRRYREQGGPRRRILADFLIGAHASYHADRLLTRDRGFFRDHFEELEVFDPSA